MASGYYPMSRAEARHLVKALEALDEHLKPSPWGLEHDQFDNAESDGGYLAKLYLAREFVAEALGEDEYGKVARSHRRLLDAATGALNWLEGLGIGAEGEAVLGSDGKALIAKLRRATQEDLS